MPFSAVLAKIPYREVTATLSKCLWGEPLRSEVWGWCISPQFMQPSLWSLFFHQRHILRQPWIDSYYTCSCKCCSVADHWTWPKDVMKVEPKLCQGVGSLPVQEMALFGNSISHSQCLPETGREEGEKDFEWLLSSMWCSFFFSKFLFRGNVEKEENTEDKLDGLQKQTVSHRCSYTMLPVQRELALLVAVSGTRLHCCTCIPQFPSNLWKIQTHTLCCISVCSVSFTFKSVTHF